MTLHRGEIYSATFLHVTVYIIIVNILKWYFHHLITISGYPILNLSTNQSLACKFFEGSGRRTVGIFILRLKGFVKDSYFMCMSVFCVMAMPFGGKLHSKEMQSLFSLVIWKSCIFIHLISSLGINCYPLYSLIINAYGVTLGRCLIVHIWVQYMWDAC